MTLGECHAQIVASPFGFHFSDPWDASRVDAMYEECVLSQPTMAAPDYPVPQRYVYKILRLNDLRDDSGTVGGKAMVICAIRRIRIQTTHANTMWKDKV